MNTRTRKSFRQAGDYLRTAPWRWAYACITPLVAPFFEMGFLYLVYLLIDLEQRTKAYTQVSQYPYGKMLLERLQSGERLFLIFLLALVLLAAGVLMRYLNELVRVGLRYDVYLADSRRLVAKYLYTGADAARRVGKDRITSGILHTCGIIGSLITDLLEFAGAVVFLIIYLAGAFALSWQMMLVAALVYAIPLYINRNVLSQMRDIGKMKIKLHEKVLQFFNDILQGFTRARMDALEEALSDRSKAVLLKSQKWRVQKGRSNARLTVFADGIAFAGILVVLYAGLVVFSMELTSLMLLFIIFNRMQTFVQRMTQSYASIRLQLPLVERYYDLLDELSPHESHESRARAGRSGSPIRRIEARDIHFAYRDDQGLLEPVLNGLHFRAEAGERILLQGPSGQGKSTLLEVLSGVVAPLSGEIRVNDRPLTDDLFFALRHEIGYVAPTVYLFRGTIRENLIIGLGPEAEESLSLALESSGLDEVVREMPQGVDTYIGVDGEQLSLGQRQRLILARIFMRRPSLVLLDEATANLDLALERRVLENLDRFLGPQSIVILVAHKVPLGMSFNRRLVVSAGRLESFAEVQL